MHRPDDNKIPSVAEVEIRAVLPEARGSFQGLWTTLFSRPWPISEIIPRIFFLYHTILYAWILSQRLPSDIVKAQYTTVTSCTNRKILNRALHTKHFFLKVHFSMFSWATNMQLGSRRPLAWSPTVTLGVPGWRLAECKNSYTYFGVVDGTQRLHYSRGAVVPLRTAAFSSRLVRAVASVVIICRESPMWKQALSVGDMLLLQVRLITERVVSVELLDQRQCLAQVLAFAAGVTRKADFRSLNGSGGVDASAL